MEKIDLVADVGQTSLRIPVIFEPENSMAHARSRLIIIVAVIISRVKRKNTRLSNGQQQDTIIAVSNCTS